MKYVYGIDLGTTYSCIAKCDDNEHVETLRPAGVYASDETSIPSIVYFEEDGTPTVGEDARNHLKLDGDAERTIDRFKLHMGKKYCPEEILVGGNKRKISPIEASACVLRSLISTIPKEENNDSMPKAVITIPAGYNNDQRQFVKNAAKFAGIEVLGLIHEPTAAAIYYGINSGDTVLVFDLGGGTLDVSVVKRIKDEYEVVDFASDEEILGHSLGGINWDEVIIDLAVNKNGWERNKNDRAMEGLLKEYAEECKTKRFSRANRVRFTDIYNARARTEELTYDEFVQMSESLLEDCVSVAIAAIEKAKQKVNNLKIDYCVMAGGSSNLRMVKKRLSENLESIIGRGRLEGEWLKNVDHPERAIAEGAARYAYRLEHHKGDKGFVLKERSLHSYGTMAYDTASRKNKIINLILSGAPLIFESTESPSFKPGQGKSVPIDVWENESLERKFDVPSDEKVRKRMVIYNEEYEAESENAEVKFKVSRDKDGIITIMVVEGSKMTPFPVMPSVSKEIKDQIKRSIDLFDKGNSKLKV